MDLVSEASLGKEQLECRCHLRRGEKTFCIFVTILGTNIVTYELVFYFFVDFEEFSSNLELKIQF